MKSLPGALSSKLVIVVAVALLLAAVGWLYYDRYFGDGKPSSNKIDSFAACVAAGNPVMESYPEQCVANGKTFSNPDQKVQNDPLTDDGWNEAVVSGKGGFSVQFPDAWSNISRDLSADIFMVRGAQQPNSGNASSAGAVQDVPSTAGSGPVVLAVWTGDNFAEPMGMATDFTLANGKENPIVGKKYTYTFAEDETYDDVMGETVARRLAGDGQYEYVFSLGNSKELRVLYNVYAADPQNQIATIEALIDTIRILK